MDQTLHDRILRHYPGASAWDHFHLRQRLARCPYGLLAAQLPREGCLLDIGCGFGHFGWFLAETGSRLEYFGSDIDARKIALALPGLEAGGVAERVTPKLHLFAGDARKWSGLPEKFQAIAMLDILYLIPEAKQTELLEFAAKRLDPRPGSVLLLKILPPLRGWPKWRTWLQERVMVALGKTKASGTVLAAQDPAWYAAWGRRHGLECREVPLPTSPASTLMVLGNAPVP